MQAEESHQQINESEFTRLLRIGLGRPILYAQRHNISQFQGLILDACLHCYAVDPICEGTRAAYMLELVELTTHKQFYCDRVLQSLPESGDDWDAAQRFHFAACLADDGNDSARQAMYEHFRPGPKFGDHIGCEFVEMDKIKGFLFAAEKIGELLLTSPGKVNLGLLLWRSGEVCGEHEIQQALRDAATGNPRLEAYRSAADWRRRYEKTRSSGWRDIAKFSYEELRPLLVTQKGYGITSWGEKASPEELVKAAHGLIAAHNPGDQLGHLYIFARRSFPLDPAALFTFAEIGAGQLARAAARALSYVTGSAVRELAFRLVETKSEVRFYVIDTLARNFQPGDHEIALKWFEAEEDPQILHLYASDMMNFWQDHPDEQTEMQMLYLLYERGPCSWYRQSVVERLLTKNALSQELRAECVYDANYDLRELVNPQRPSEDKPS